MSSRNCETSPHKSNHCLAVNQEPCYCLNVNVKNIEGNRTTGYSKEYFLMFKKIITLIILLLLALTAGVFIFAPAIVDRQMNPVSAHDLFKISEEAKALHETLIVGDWHADSTLWNRDLSQQYKYGHVDIPRLQKGNVGLQMFTTVTKSPAGQNYEENETNASDNITSLAILQRWPLRTWDSLAERALFQADKIHDLVKRDAQNVMLIQYQSDLDNWSNRRIANPSLIGALIGTEGSHALDGNLENIKRLYDHGFRMMSLQHFFDNKLGGSLHGTSGEGLTDFGHQAIEEMLDLDIIIDLSHSSENVVRDVLEMSDQPLVISHTGFKGHCPSARNIDDQLMQQIAARGGLIAVGFWDAAICDNSPKVVAEAIKYGIDLIGADHVSLGSDFDGTITPGFDSSELIAITHELLALDITYDEVKLVMGENMFRFLKENLPKK